MRIAPEGRPFILGAWIIVVALGLVSLWAAAAWLPIAIWVVAFFRDPVRDGARGDRLVLAPADGLVVSIVNVDEPVYLQGRATRISIFMNVFDVHVNRYPATGTIGYRHYNKGSFGHAGTEKASLENEQSTVGMETARGKLLLRQIAGLVARRIVTDHQPGTRVEQAERLGLIRFGSRVDVFVPADLKVLVHVGERTKAGQTVVAEWA